MSAPGPLTGRTVVVAGATGGIGEGVTLALLRAGATTVAVGRNATKLTALADYVGDTGPGRLVTAVADVGRADDTAVRAALAPFGPLHGAVVTIGDWGPGGRTGILDTSDQTWSQMIENNLTSHFHALRALVPLLSRDGALVHLSGLSAEVPYPFSALVGATNAAKESLARSLDAELGGAGPRIYELIIGPIRTRPRAALGTDDPGWSSAEELGAHAARLISGVGEIAEHPLQYLIRRADGVRVTSPR